MSVFSTPQLYRNINHSSYKPEETQFDEGEFAVEGSPQPGIDPKLKDAELNKTKSKGKNKSKSKKRETSRGRRRSMSDSEDVEAAGVESRFDKQGVEDASDNDVDSADEKQFSPDSRHERKTQEKSKKQQGSNKKQQQKNKKNRSKSVSSSEDEQESEEDVDDKKKQTSSKVSERRGSASNISPSLSSRPSSSHQQRAETTESTSDSVFSQLLLESILEKKSVADFVNGMPDKRGTLLIRFPTSTFQKSWKKRYFTLHGDTLYHHEDQSVIHPSSGSGTAVNYKDCKKISIADYWIIQQDDSTASAMTLSNATKNAGSDSNAASIYAAAAAAAALASGNPGAAMHSHSSEKVYGGGQPIPANLDPEKAGGLPTNSSSSMSSKFDEIFRSQKDKDNKNKDKDKDKEKEKDKDKEKEKDKDKKEKDKKEPSFRGRRRSSLVNEQGKIMILLLPKPEQSDSKSKTKSLDSASSSSTSTTSSKSGSSEIIELTGINEGSLGDLVVLNEWIHAINARICLMHFLHSPMNATNMSRGGREVLAFLTDTNSQTLKIENKFTELTSIFSHFKELFLYRTFSSAGAMQHSPLRIVLKNCAMIDSAFRELCVIIQQNPNMNIELLDVSGNLLTKTSMEALHDALKVNKNIQNIVLDQNQIGDEGLNMLIYGNRGDHEGGASPPAPSNPDDASASASPSPSGTTIWDTHSKLHSISCASNQITDIGFEYFFTSILEYLHMEEQNRRIHDEEEMQQDKKHGKKKKNKGQKKHISELSQHDQEIADNYLTFQKLSFHSNMISDLGIQVISGFLQRNPQVHSINLGGNNLTDASMYLFAKILESPERCLEELNLEKNASITNKGVECLLDALNAPTSSEKGQHIKKQMFSLNLSANYGIDAHIFQKLNQIRTTVEGHTSPNGTPLQINPVHFEQLSFTLHDPMVLENRLAQVESQGIAACYSPQHSPAPKMPQERKGVPSVAAISTSQQNVLNLFSPAGPPQQVAHQQYPRQDQKQHVVTPNQQHLLDLFGLPAPNAHVQAAAPPAQTQAKQNPQPQSQPQQSVAPAAQSSSSTAVEAPAQQSRSGKKNKKKKKSGQFHGSDASAPKVAIRESDDPQLLARSKRTVAPLHPPPQFAEPDQSPDAVISDAHLPMRASQLPPHFTQPPLIVNHPTPNGANQGVTPGVHDDEGETPTQSLTNQAEKRKPMTEK